MTRILAGIAALTIMGAAALPLPASAAEPKAGISKEVNQPTDVSSRHRRWHRGYYVPRHHYWGPRYGYYRYPYRYRYAYPYRYGYGYPYYHRPGIAFGIGPFGFGIF